MDLRHGGDEQGDVVRGTLRTRRQFARVYDHGRKAVGAHCVIYALQPAPEEAAMHGELASGVVASKKVGGAVRRNRAKRRLREAFRALLPRLRSPLWVVLIARAAAAEDGFTTPRLTQEMEELFLRLGCIVPREEEGGRGSC